MPESSGDESFDVYAKWIKTSTSTTSTSTSTTVRTWPSYFIPEDTAEPDIGIIDERVVADSDFVFAKDIVVSCPMCESPIEATVHRRKNEGDGSPPYIFLSVESKQCDCPYVVMSRKVDFKDETDDGF